MFPPSIAKDHLKYCFHFLQDGSTLMHIASQAGHPDTALVFLKKGVPLHMPNKVSTGIKNSSCAKAP